MNISDSRMDNITHAVAAILEANGITLSDNLKSDLNDELSGFLEEKCVCTREEDTKHNTPDIIQIGFDIEGGVNCQNVEVIDSTFDEASIIDGLSNGTLTTTMSFGGTRPPAIMESKSKHIVAYILGQEFNGELIEFR